MKNVLLLQRFVSYKRSALQCSRLNEKATNNYKFQQILVASIQNYVSKYNNFQHLHTRAAKITLKIRTLGDFAIANRCSFMAL